MHLTDEQQTLLKQKLLEQQEKLEKVMASFDVSDPAMNEDRTNDNADVGNEAGESEELVRHQSLRTETTIMIDRIKEALERLEEGSYGYTADGKEIPYERLLVDPTATTLVS